MSTQTHTENTLSIDVTETGEEIRLHWRGKSNEREPARFIAPILGSTLEKSDNGKKSIVMDFSSLEYMNSSTFSPIVRMLAQVAKGPHRVVVEYSQTRKWQQLSFAALRAFDTRDGRVSIRAK